MYTMTVDEVSDPRRGRRPRGRHNDKLPGLPVINDDIKP